MKSCGILKMKSGYVKKTLILKKNLFNYPEMYILQMTKDPKLSQKLIKNWAQIQEKLSSILNIKTSFF